MIVLDATTKILQLIATGTCDVTVSGYVEGSSNPGFAEETNATASTQTICAAPGSATTSKNISGIKIVDTSGASNTLTVQVYNSSGTKTTKQFKATIAANESLQCSHSGELTVTDTSGQKKEVMPGYLPLSGGTISGAITYGGVTLTNAVTGTGNMVLSANQTLTGTLTAATANWSGLGTFNAGATVASGQTLTLTGVTVTGGVMSPASVASAGAISGTTGAFSTSISERSRTTPIGEWITPDYAAGDFTAFGSMTWDVAAGDVTTYQYMLLGKTMFMNFYIATSTVGGTPSSDLKIKIPGGHTAAKTSQQLIDVYPAGSWQVGYATVSAGVTSVSLQRDLASSNWTVSGSNNVYVAGSIVFEIQ